MTQYFSSFPYIDYNGRSVKDITIRLDFLTRIKSNVSLFEHKLLKDGERPEDVALIEYGNPALYWIVLYMNDVVDPYYDWLLDEQRLYEYVVTKYGADKINSVHHYETLATNELGAGVWVSSNEPFTKPVTNFAYEESLNEQKRKIKVLKNRYIPQVLAEYQSELRDRTLDT